MPPIEGPLTSGNSRHAIKLMIHIHICLTASRKTYDARMIENTIELAREALALTTKNSADRNYACLLLAESLGQRFDHHGEDSLLEEMISLKREVLTLSPEGHPGRASMCESLGISLWTRYKRTSDVTLLDEAIDLQREALSLRPPEHPSRYMSCENLGVILWTRYQRTGDVNLLDEAIYLQRGVLDFCPAGHPDRASSCGKLASLLKTLYESTGDIGILDEAINLQREALDTCLAGHPNRSMSYGNLANSLLARYERMGDVSLLNEVINLERQALDLRPAGNSYRYVSCGNLANSLWMHYQRVGDVGLLDEAIDLQREALDLCLAGQPDRSLYCGNLANSITTRYQRTGDASLLDEAIDLQREALDLCPSGHPDRSSWCTNLANSLKKRFERTGDVDLLDEAVYLQREALNLCPQGHPSRFLTCETLAHSLCACYVRTGEVGLLDEAIDLHRETLDFCPAEHPDRTMFCRNLAALLCLHYQRTGNVSTLDESLAYSQEGVATAPVHEVWRCLHILARTFLEKTSPGYDNSKVISCLSQSLKHDPDDPLEFVESLSSLLSNIWECNLEGEHIQLITIYQRLVNFLPLLVHPALGLQSQLQALKTCTRLGSDALVNAVLAKKTTVGFEILELAQGVIWSQSLHRRDPQLQDVPEHLASKLQGLLQSFARSSAAQPYDEERKWLTPRDTLHIRSSQADAVIREIRALPGLERFMLGETFETLRTTASNHPVVVLVGAHGHFYALLLAASLAKGHVVLSLDLSDENLTSLSFTRRSARARRSDVTSKETQEEGDRAGLKKTERASFKLLGGQLQTLWHKVVKPVLAHLGLESLRRGCDRPRLHWCATGLFSNLPLHAAGIYDGSHKICCSDFVVSSYTPTVTTLLRAQQATKPLLRGQVSLALVAEKRAAQRNLELIPEVEKEIEHVAAVANLCGVEILHQWVGLTTIKDTSRVMEAATIVHLACHGIQDANDATQSGFCLGDGRLTIAKLMELKLDNAFLAFLSACETAKGDKEQPDQAMHLAAAMLFSGFKSVIATMWVITDIDGPKVAKWFYEELLAKEVVDVDSVAYALDSAVGKLRDSGASPERWAPFIHMGA